MIFSLRALPALVGLFSILTLTACEPARLQTGTHIQTSIDQIPLRAESQYRSELTKAGVEPDAQLVMTKRLLSNNKSFNAFYSGGYSQYPSRAAWVRAGHLVDATIQFDLTDKVPLYKITLGAVNFGQAEVNNWPDYLTVTMETGNRQWVYLIAKLPEDRTLTDKQISTDWVYCPACIRSGMTLDPAKSKDDNIRVFDQTMTRINAWAKYRSQPNSEGNRIRNLMFSESTTRKFVTGRDEAEKARAQLVAHVQGFEEKRALAKAANASYNAFFTKVVQPLTIHALLKKNRCPAKYNASANPYWGTDGQRELISENRAYIRCHTRSLRAWDAAGYAAILPELKEREKELWERSFGIKRKTIYSAEAQVKDIQGRVEGAHAGIDDMYDRIDEMAEKRAERERQRRATQQAFMNTQMQINQMQQQVRDMAPVVRADGTVSSVGQERARALAAGRAALARDRAEEAERRRAATRSTRSSSSYSSSRSASSSSSSSASSSSATSSGSGKSASASGGSGSGSAVQTGGSSGGGAEMQGAAGEATQSQAADDLAQQQQEQARQLAEQEAAEQARRDAEEQARQQAEEQARRDAEELARQQAEEARRQKEEARRLAEEEAARKRAEAEAERRRREAIQPIRGGEFGCVTVLKAKRTPGSSAHSSCSYNTPDREELEITFLNKCSVPVNIEINLNIDDGTNRKSGEYNVKPGRKRTTVGYCGALNYAFTYEETRDSLNKRRGQ
ncbi:MAG: hypothetical protein Alpg2KO_31790 [Alphaproteobacteria bacterium]